MIELEKSMNVLTDSEISNDLSSLFMILEEEIKLKFPKELPISPSFITDHLNEVNKEK